jgi:predicted CXXCH cytochrome family protein
MACGGCHAREYRDWLGSHHQLAMQPATASTVLGNFSNATLTSADVTSAFFKRGKDFMVRTAGPDGALHDYKIADTFGVMPLQQYLIAFPGGRLQAFGIAWDSRPLAAGGQRWFSLYPGQKITTSSPLYWTGIDQTWNYMCADCHSTNLRKNYDVRARGYATTYAEIDVACEACHGPGSDHIAWAKHQNDWRQVDATEGLTIALNERRGVYWLIDPVSRTPRRSQARSSEREIEMCARCHSRRSQIHEDYVHGQPLGDDYRAALLDEDLYFPDGQIKGEVYEYGSFIQSRMYREGVTCSDCHDPHTSRLRADGNRLCAQCHLPEKYDSPRHHFHQVGSAGAQCVACHMPARTYMVIDPRRDHSIRIPRPDLSALLGTPNACNNCHTGKSAEWAATALKHWYGKTPVGLQRFAETLQAGFIGAPGAANLLSGLSGNLGQAPIARATALEALGTLNAAPVHSDLAAASGDSSALVRRAAASLLASADMRSNAASVPRLLKDPVRAVRIEAADALAGGELNTLPADIAAALSDASSEYLDAQSLNADRPEAHLNVALFYTREGKFPAAESELKTAIALDPSFVPASVNLADLYRQLGRDDEGEAILRQALQQMPDDASLLNALGLLKVRQKQGDQALGLFAAAVRSDPSNVRYFYVYALALNEAGQTAEAISTLEHSLALHPYDQDSLAALISFCDRLGDRACSAKYARILDQIKAGQPPAVTAANGAGISN